MKFFKFLALFSITLVFGGEISDLKTSQILSLCEKKDAAACHEAGLRYKGGLKGVTRNLYKSQGMFARACELGEGELKTKSCLDNADVLLTFASGACKSLVIYDTFCQNANERACKNLENLMAQGWNSKEGCNDEVMRKFGHGRKK